MLDLLGYHRLPLLSSNPDLKFYYTYLTFILNYFISIRMLREIEVTSIPTHRETRYNENPKILSHSNLTISSNIVLADKSVHYCHFLLEIEFLARKIRKSGYVVDHSVCCAQNYFQ